MNSTTFPLLRTATCALVLGLALGSAHAADKPATPRNAAATKTVAPKPAARTARIGGGQIVPMAPSKFTSAQLAGMRPHYDALKPKLNNP